MNALTGRLARVGATGLPGSGPQDPPEQWLGTIRGNLSQSSVCDFLTIAISLLYRSSAYYFAVGLSQFFVRFYCLSKRCCAVATKIRARWMKVKGL